VTSTPPSSSPATPHAPDKADLRSVRGAALRAARNLAGLSAPKLADRVNERTRGGSPVSKDAIYAYESGKVLLPHEVGVRIATVLNLHPGELLAGDPDFRDAAPDTPTPTSAPARPAANTPTARWLGLAGQPVSVARVLARVLDARPMGDTSAKGFVSVFQLLLADLKAVTGHAVADTVRHAQRGEGWDHLADVLTAAEAGAAAVTTHFRELLKRDPDELDAEQAGERAAEALRELAAELETAVTQGGRLYAPAD